MSRLHVPTKRFFDDNLRGKLSADMRLSHTTASVFNNRLKTLGGVEIEHAAHQPQALSISSIFSASESPRPLIVSS